MEHFCLQIVFSLKFLKRLKSSFFNYFKVPMFTNKIFLLKLQKKQKKNNKSKLDKERYQKMKAATNLFFHLIFVIV